MSKFADPTRPCGTARKAATGCACELCASMRARRKRMNSRTEKRRRVTGLAWQGFVDAQPARRHVSGLLRSGMTRHQIALLAGLGEGGRTVIRNLIVGQPPRQGPAKRLRVGTAAALLAVPVAPCMPVVGATCDATGCRRRVRALVAIGWTEAEIARRLGCTTANLQAFSRARCESASAIAMRRLYDELADRPGPSGLARARAHREGWLGPLWWDEDTIDDPTAEPAGVQEYDTRGQLVRDRTAHRWDEVERLTNLGLDIDAITERLGISRKQARRDIARARGEKVS